MLAILLGLAIVLGSAYAAAAALVYDEVSRVPPDCDGNYVGYTPTDWSPPAWAIDFEAERYFVDRYETVSIPSRDAGIDLHGWWLPANEPEAPVVIVVHGRGGCVRHPEVLAPAGMLHRLGFGVLLIDLRDHGSSTIEDGRYAGGTEEYRDVMGAVDWLIDASVPAGQIGVLGTSLGAATTIIAAGEDDRIARVWSDSGFADIEQRIAEELAQRGLPTFLAPASTLVARLISGDDLAAHTVLGEIEDLEGRELFITHGELDETTFVSHAYDLLAAARAAGVNVEDWIVPDAGHVQAVFLHPAEYEARLGSFFGPPLAPA